MRMANIDLLIKEGKEKSMEHTIQIGKKVGAVIAAGALAASLTIAAPVQAYAGTPSGAGTYVTAAATRAAGPSVEILGADSVEESGQFVNTTDWYDWTKPKYYLFASSYNTNPSNYLYNLANNYTPAAILNTSRAGSGAGPNAALDGTSDSTDAQVLALADVVVGNGGDTSKGVTYSFTNNASLVTTMDAIATALDAADAADDTKTLRYGSASAIAQQYEEYIYGTTGYIQEQLNSDDSTLEKKTVALVSGVTATTENGVTSYTYTLLKTSTSGAGTASTNRYLEAAMGNSLGMDIADNYADSLSGTTVTVTADQLANNVDLVMVGGQQGSSSYDDIIAALKAGNLLSKTYYVEDNSTQGAAYGVVMNSVENAQNIGRILGCLYSEVVDQDDFVAYYYDNFYHIESSSLATVMDNALDGVRNWDADLTGISDPTDSDYAEWTTADAASYSESAVQAKITEGYEYYLENYA